MKKRSWASGWGVAVLVLVGLVVFPVAGAPVWILSLAGQIMALALFALSFDLLFGYTGVVSFGHAAFWGIGGYAIAIASRAGGGAAGILLLGAVAGIVLAAALGVVEGLILSRVKAGYFAMVTLAISQILLLMASSQNLRPYTGGSDGLNVYLPRFLLSGPAIYYLLLAVLVLSFVVLYRLVRSPAGLVWRGMRENESRIESMGHDVLAYKVAVNVVSGMFAAVAGMLYMLVIQIATPELFGLSNSLSALLMVIIGGAGTLVGPVVGAVILVLAEHELSSIGSNVPFLSHWLILFGLMFILIVMVAPRGLMGALDKLRARAAARTTGTVTGHRS